MFALSFPGFHLECTFTYLSRLHARVKSICQSSVVQLHGYSTPNGYSTTVCRIEIAKRLTSLARIYGPIEKQARIFDPLSVI